MFKGDVYKGVIQKGQSSNIAILISLGSNRFVDAKDVASFFDLLKLKKIKKADSRIIPMIDYQKGLNTKYISYGMAEQYFDSKETFKHISLKKVKKLH